MPERRTVDDPAWKAAAAEALCCRLRDDSSASVRSMAALALGRLSAPPVVEALILALRHDEQPVRRAAALALGMAGDHRAVQPLLETLGSEPGVCREAAGALARLGAGEVAGDLIRLVGAPVAEPIRRAATWALGELLSETPQDLPSRTFDVGSDDLVPYYVDENGRTHILI